MFYNFKDFKVLINNIEVLANSAQLSVSNSLAPVYEINNRHTSKYAPTNGLVGNLRLSYYLTGQDPLKTYITNEKDVISGNIGGLYFKSGYLSSYSFDGANNSPIIINSDIVFFSNIEGTFNPTSTPPQNIENKVFNFSDASISTLDDIFAGGLGNIISFSYNFSNNIAPVYALTTGENADNVTLDRVMFGVKQISSEILTDDLNLDVLSFQGISGGLTLTSQHPTSNISESYTVSGIFTQRNISASTNDLVRNSISIQQNNVDPLPRIAAFTNPIQPGQTFNILGSNLENTIDISINGQSINDFRVQDFALSDSDLVIVKAPLDIISGLLTVKTYGGEATSTDNIEVIYPEIIVNSVTPMTGKENNLINIQGENFYRIDRVTFNGVSGSFQRLSDTAIHALVPKTTSGLVNVASSLRGKSGSFGNNFVPTPFISGFLPSTGVSGQRILVSGSNFAGTTNIYFNSISVTGFDVVSNNEIVTYIPSGNVEGFAQFVGASGVTSFSNHIFEPSISILGIDPPSGQTGTALRITGYNLNSALLFETEQDFYRVRFHKNVEANFKIDEILNGFSGVITGLIPEAVSGPLYIIGVDGSKIFKTGFYWTRINSSPVIESRIIGPTYSGNSLSMSVLGKNLFNVTELHFTGIQEGINNDYSFDIDDSFLVEDIFGTKLNVNNYPLVDIGSTGWWDWQIRTSQPSTGFSSRVHRINILPPIS